MNNKEQAGAAPQTEWTIVLIAYCIQSYHVVCEENCLNQGCSQNHVYPLSQC